MENEIDPQALNGLLDKRPIRVTQRHYDDMKAWSLYSEDHKAIFDNLVENGVEIIPVAEIRGYEPDYAVSFMYPAGAARFHAERKQKEQGMSRMDAV